MTLIPHPPDGCPNCLTYAETVITEPYSARLDTGGSVLACYQCPACRYMWQTWWSVSALGVRALGGAA